MDILRQLGNLFLQAVPTIIIVFLFYLFLRWAFFAPIDRVLEERRKRTEGARREAEQARAAARERAQAYQDALKKARNEIYAQQEAARQKLLEERTARLHSTRAQAGERVRLAKAGIDADLAAARREIEAAAPALAAEIVRSILGPAQSGPGSSSEVR